MCINMLLSYPTLKNCWDKDNLVSCVVLVTLQNILIPDLKIEGLCTIFS